MENTIKVSKIPAIGLAVIIAVIGFTFAACGDGGGGGGAGHVHVWSDDWTEITPATCIDKGLKTRACLLDPSHTEDGEIDVDPNGHDFGDTETVTKEATCDDEDGEGEGEGTCIFCGEHTTKTLAKLDHDYEWVETQKPNFTKKMEETEICTHDSSHTGKTREVGDTLPYFSSVEELGEYLETYDSPTSVTDPYRVNLRVKADTELDGIRDALGGAAGDKYVYLDLTGSTITTIPANTFGGSANPWGTVALVGVIIPDGVITIEAGAFRNCANLASVTIPASVTSIASGTAFGSGPFQTTSIGMIVTFERGSNITSFGSLAFMDMGGSGENVLRDLYNITGKEGIYKRIGYTAWVKEIDFIPTANITTLIADTWADGNLPTSGSVQWFTFTANANVQNIHFTVGTLNPGVVVLLDSTGRSVGSNQTMSGSGEIIRPWAGVVPNNVYYIKVQPNTTTASGTYQIKFSVATAAAALTANTWEDGNITTAGGRQVFTFTATASPQYIHAYFDTLTSLYMNVYDASGAAVGGQTSFNTTNKYASRTVTPGQTYYVVISPSSATGSGTYRIGFTNSTTVPSTTITLPTANITPLTLNTWKDGNLPANGVQWFSFTATASTQYIHASSGDLTSLYVTVYDSGGISVGGRTNLYGVQSTSRTVTPSQTYYIMVTPYEDYSGTYKIAFCNTIVPLDTSLTLNTWADGDLSGGDVWFSFTATASTQYFHLSFNTRTTWRLDVYDSNFNSVDSKYEYYVSDPTNSISRTGFTSGQTYYFKVYRYNYGGGAFKIAVNTSSTAPAQ